jgi:hypothetical protein
MFFNQVRQSVTKKYQLFPSLLSLVRQLDAIVAFCGNVR